MTPRAETPMNFDDAYDMLCVRKGSLEEDKRFIGDDGPEYRGFTQKWNPGFDVMTMTPEEHKLAVEIIYWDRLFGQFESNGCDNCCIKPKKLAQGVAFPIFAMAFNAGHEDAVRLAEHTNPFAKESGILGPHLYSFLYGIEKPLEWWRPKDLSGIISPNSYYFQCRMKYASHEKEKGLLNRLAKIDAWLREEV